MHELPFAKSIFNTVVEKARQNEAERIVRVVIEVGALRDFVPEIVQKYWLYVTRGSMAEGSLLEMKEIPATVRCRDCGITFPVNMTNIKETRCPKCRCDMGTLVTGRELRILGIEIR